MANGNGENGNGKTQNITWNVVVPVGALALLATMVMNVNHAASTSLELAKQNGESLVVMQKMLLKVQDDIDDKTQLRYTARDAERDHGYIVRDIADLKEQIRVIQQENKDVLSHR